MIGNTDKENSLPSLERGKKSKGKCPAASDTNMSTSGLIRKSCTIISPTLMSMISQGN